MLLNCDLSEGMPYDRKIMPLVDMANLACGAHAGSAELMRENIASAVEHGVMIGAHPGYPDKENFGRVSTELNSKQIESELIYQIGALDALCKVENTHISYVKPHGALYNDMMGNEGLFEMIAQIIARFDESLKLMILSTPENDRYSEIASRYGIGLLYEMFADRNYTDDGYLVPRSKPDAVIHDVDDIVRRIEAYRNSKILLSISGKPLQMECDTLCVHGDNQESLSVIKALRDMLG